VFLCSKVVIIINIITTISITITFVAHFVNSKLQNKLFVDLFHREKRPLPLRQFSVEIYYTSDNVDVSFVHKSSN
jgi:hypothetical protein